MPASLTNLRLDLNTIPFVRARNFTKSNRQSGDIDWIVLHSMESQEKPGTARRVADWFAGPTSPPASAHFCIDPGNMVQCVRCEDVAWHAPGANLRGIGIEHAGRAAQSAEDWYDTFSMATLGRSILLAQALCRRYMIPADLVDPIGLIRGQRGITTHDFVSKAWKKSTHTDPGEHFPLAWYVARVAEGLA